MKSMLIKMGGVMMVLCLFVFCNKDNAFLVVSNSDFIKPLVGNPELLWRTKLTGEDDGLIGGYSDNIVASNEVVFYGAVNKIKCLHFLDKSTGKITATWNDWFDAKYLSYRTKKYYFNHILVVTDISGSYGIDVNSKKTLWRNYALHDVDEFVSGTDEYYFYSRIPNEAKEGAGSSELIMGNILTKQEQCILKLSPNQDTSYATLRFAVRKTKDNNIYFIYSDWYLTLRNGSNVSPNYMGIYNLENKKMIKFLLNDSFTTTMGDLALYNNYIICEVGGAKGVACFDKVTFEKKWQIKANLGSDGFTLDESSGMLYVSMNDMGDWIRAIDAETGHVIWSQKVGNTTSKPFLMNGVVYFTTSALYALDAKTGEVIWKIGTGKDESYQSDFSNHNVTGDGERVYVSSDMYAYCFKAAR